MTSHNVWQIEPNIYFHYGTGQYTVWVEAPGNDYAYPVAHNTLEDARATVTYVRTDSEGHSLMEWPGSDGREHFQVKA